jgi:hypothetical protein
MKNMDNFIFKGANFRLLETLIPLLKSLEQLISPTVGAVWITKIFNIVRELKF